MWRICLDVVRAVAHLHGQDPPIAHRDVKLENILHSPRAGCYKLCDFGSCMVGPVVFESEKQRAEEEERIERFTTLSYRAPEMVDFFGVAGLTEAVDVWVRMGGWVGGWVAGACLTGADAQALGIVLYALAFRQHPFQDKGKLGILSAECVAAGRVGKAAWAGQAGRAAPAHPTPTTDPSQLHHPRRLAILQSPPHLHPARADCAGFRAR